MAANLSRPFCQLQWIVVEDARVKGGGVLTPQGFLFELTGAALCLDFANTVDNRREPSRRKELLSGYAELASWARQAGVLDREHEDALVREAVRRPREAAKTLARAAALREALFAAFSEIAAGRQAPAPALAVLNEALPGALGGLHLKREDGAYTWAWSPTGAGLDLMLAPVVLSAAELLVSPDLSRVRECAAESCGWLFLDKSKNRTRRWCDMTVCGNRAKARRFRSNARRA